uniref:Methyltransferase type 11 domain-containing protein n=1 Tax=Plectus sambesii TaxID=2011161 RepID=A0A914XEM7_9BILA
MSGGFVGQSVSKAFHAVRPTLPSNLVQRIAQYVGAKIPSPNLAVDVGCGTGLSTMKLAEGVTSNKWVGMDISETQIEEAKRQHADKKIEFLVHNSDKGLPFGDGEVDLITVVQAAHWLNLDVFFKECERVLRPGGVVALCAYGIVRPIVPGLNDEQNRSLTKLIRKLNDDLQVAGFWETNRERLVNDYNDVNLPFADQLVYREDAEIFLQKQSTISDFLNYIDSWSALTNSKNDTQGLRAEFER